MENKIVSIITPFYKGESFLPRLEKMIEANLKTIEKKHLPISLEYVLVNDSPDHQLIFPSIKGMTVRVITNYKNMGIHRTRINGVNEANGDYIIFLDQDDIISSDLVASQFEHIKNYDMVIANGVMDYRKTELILIRNEFMRKELLRDYYYLYTHCPIVSPGQCMIKKSSIPEAWMKYHLKTNCSDDYLLYLLMFNAGKKFVTNEKSFVYHHILDGNNASLSSENNYKSDLEVIDVLKKVHAKVDYKRLYRVAKINILENIKYSII